MFDEINDLTISSALQNPVFRKYLSKTISGELNWELIANKCTGRNNEFCLKYIKAKTWIDKSSDSGINSETNNSYREIFYKKFQEYFYISVLSLISDWDKNKTFHILARNIEKQDFLGEVLLLADDIVQEVLMMNGIKFEFCNNFSTDNYDELDMFYNIFRRTEFSYENFVKQITDEKYNLFAIYPLIIPDKQFLEKKENIVGNILIWEYIILN